MQIQFTLGSKFLVYGKLVKYLINFARFMLFCQSKSPLLYTFRLSVKGVSLCCIGNNRFLSVEYDSSPI